MECWNCGSENKLTNQWCTSCAVWLTDTRDGEPIRLPNREEATCLCSSICKIALYSAITSVVVICIMVTIVGTFDLILGHRMLAGIGASLAWTGWLVAFSTHYVAGRGMNKMVVYGYMPKTTRTPFPVFHKTITTRWTKSMKMNLGSPDSWITLIQLVAGMVVLIIGLALV